MEEEQAHRYYTSMQEQGSAAASRRQGLGFSDDNRYAKTSIYAVMATRHFSHARKPANDPQVIHNVQQFPIAASDFLTNSQLTRPRLRVLI